MDNGGGGSHSTTKRRGNGKAEPELGVEQGKDGALGAFYRASEGAEQPGCAGEWWPSVGELKYMVMARGGMGIEWAMHVLGVVGLGDTWFPWRRRSEGARRSGDGQTGGGGAVIRRTKMTSWWAFVGRTAEKPTGLAK
jgi:hypothetical protein